MRGLRALHARPNFGLAVDDPAGRGRRLHRRMRIMGDVILGLDLLVRARKSGGEVAFAAHDLARPSGGRLHRRAEDLRIIGRVGPWSHVIFSASRPRIAAQVLSAITAIPPDGLNFMGKDGAGISTTWTKPGTFFVSVAS